MTLAKAKDRGDITLIVQASLTIITYDDKNDIIEQNQMKFFVHNLKINSTNFEQKTTFFHPCGWYSKNS